MSVSDVLLFVLLPPCIGPPLTFEFSIYCCLSTQLSMDLEQQKGSIHKRSNDTHFGQYNPSDAQLCHSDVQPEE